MWGWGLRTDRVYSLSTSLALQTLINNNNNNNINGIIIIKITYLILVGFDKRVNKVKFLGVSNNCIEFLGGLIIVSNSWVA